MSLTSQDHQKQIQFRNQVHLIFNMRGPQIDDLVAEVSVHHTSSVHTPIIIHTTYYLLYQTYTYVM